LGIPGNLALTGFAVMALTIHNPFHSVNYSPPE
jgi:hypothetical protein